MKIHNKVLRELKEIAELLPESYREAKKVVPIHSTSIEGNEAKNSFDIMGQSFNIVKEGKFLEGFEKRPTVYTVNHFKRLKKAYLQGFKKAGNEGAAKAVQEYGESITGKNKKLEDKFKFLTSLILTKKIMQSKIETIF